MPGMRAAWLPLGGGAKGCMVEPSLGGCDLETGRAGLGSGRCGTYSLGEEP